MGTNFYVRCDVCEHCDRYEERHIGKRSGGWSFSFRGYKGEIESEEDWRKYLFGNKIYDEYGAQYSEEDFWQMVDDFRSGKNHSKLYGKDPAYHLGRLCWVDDKGNSFQDCEFC